ncbi:conserved hypothetical protein [Xenorhabdus bovienii str. puntauvense]|uniref:Uncharacterized protein n=2 Tax=Xenorhabdus bovienii TaxID=40576 RepID=A0A077NIU6_XENBV|nr:conserved hypothetical protein [Xenorhabdus bovienii str. puntauvense]
MCVQILCSSYGSDNTSRGTMLTFTDKTIKKIDGTYADILGKMCYTAKEQMEYLIEVDHLEKLMDEAIQLGRAAEMIAYLQSNINKEAA